MEDREATPLSEQPGEVVMDRTEVEPNPAPEPESLKSKLMAHYKKGMKKPPAPKSLRSPLAPEIVDYIAVPMYLFTVFAGFYLGVFHMVPLVFAGDERAMLFHRCFISLLCLQMMVNWLGIRCVDSSYSRYLRLYGPPLHDRDASPMTGNFLLTSSSTQVVDNSAAVLMPVTTDKLDDNDKHGSKPSCVAQSANSHYNNGYTSARLIPVGATIRQGSLDLKQEVELANKAMHRRNSQINKRSIDDLLKRPRHESNLPPTAATLPEIPDTTASTLPSFSVENDTENFDTEQLAGNPTINQAARIGSALTCPTPTVTTNGEVMTKSYPYWSWVPCYPCGRARPPRCHHCPLCQTCVLKRDHHCYFAGSCVGYRNHRFFYVFLVWAWSGAMYGTLYGGPYIWNFLWPEMSYIDILFPVALLRAVLGYLPMHIALTVTAVSFMVYFDGLAGLFIYAHTRLIHWGVTSFEKVFLRKSLEIRDTRNFGQKIRSVFGPYWPVYFILPIHFFTEPQEDPVLWPDIEVFKS